jgi:hypothetical protein
MDMEQNTNREAANLKQVLMMEDNPLTMETIKLCKDYITKLFDYRLLLRL